MKDSKILTLPTSAALRQRRNGKLKQRLVDEHRRLRRRPCTLAAAHGWCATNECAMAPEKARTCVLGGKPSKAFEDMVNNGHFAALSLPLVPHESGEPIVVDGLVISEVGVSGVKASEDAQVAQAGIASIDALLKSA